MDDFIFLTLIFFCVRCMCYIGCSSNLLTFDLSFDLFMYFFFHLILCKINEPNKDNDKDSDINIAMQYWNTTSFLF